METKTNPMAGLYSRLTRFGLPKAYVRSKILPSWWDDSAAEEPAGLMEAAMLIARHVGVDVRSLVAHDAPVAANTSTAAFRFKKNRGTEEADLIVARHLAAQVARIVTLGVLEPTSIPASASLIRQQILDGGAPWIDLSSLLDYCWSHGVPVTHVSQFPQGVRRMAGLSARSDGRSAIVISLERKSPAWLLFILAHELGHIALGHLEEQDVMIDEKVERESTDELESAANRFAIELLCGDPDTAVRPESRWPNAAELARIALQIGRENQIDPGHIVLVATRATPIRAGDRMLFGAEGAVLGTLRVGKDVEGQENVKFARRTRNQVVQMDTARLADMPNTVDDVLDKPVAQASSADAGTK